LPVSATHEVRRVIDDLRPGPLEQLGLLDALRDLADRTASEFPELTEREREVLTHMAAGRSNAAIAGCGDDSAVAGLSTARRVGIEAADPFANHCDLRYVTTYRRGVADPIGGASSVYRLPTTSR
jgi:hypothetical protein